MDNLLTTLIILIIVFVVGALLGAFLVARPWQKLFVMQHSLSLIGQIDVAKRIRSNATEELLSQIESNLGAVALQMSEEFDYNQGTLLDALWVLKDYYEKYVGEIPNDLLVLFEKLAPNPLVSKTCYELDKVCSANPKCLKNPTSLQPLSNTPDPYGFTATGKCGSKRRWFWRVPCGKPVTATVCF